MRLVSCRYRCLVWAIRLLALGLIALGLVAPHLPEAVAWGVWPATYLPVGWRWALALIAAGLALGGDRLPLGRLGRIRLGAPALTWGLALLAAVPFYLFRLQHLRWGDAFILVNAISHPTVRMTYVWQAPLDVFLHAKAWALGNRLFGWPDPLPVYWILSIAAGVLFVGVLLAPAGVARRLGRTRAERVLVVGLVATLGTMQLFFGYVENYSLMTVGVLIYIWLALRALAGEIGLIWPATALALTHALHPSTIILAPSLLWLAWERGRAGHVAAAPADENVPVGQAAGLSLPRRRQSGGLPHARIVRMVLALALPYLLVLAGVLALMTAGGHGVAALLGADFPGGGDRRWFVPLFQTSTRWEHYTMFSLGHLADVVNEQLLVAPAILPGLALIALFAWRRLPWRDATFRLLLVISGLYLLLTLVWNPDYGGQRDWDLFAPASVPAALLLAYTLPRVVSGLSALRAAGWALIAAQAYHLITWVYQNTRPWEWK